MSQRSRAAVWVVFAVVGVTPVIATAQSTSLAALPRTPWGDPDLQGTWTNSTTTPLERPEDLAEGQVLTDEERAARDEAGARAREQRGETPRTGETGSYNNYWLERGTQSSRPSLIVDPPDGRLPTLTPKGRRLRTEDATARNRVAVGPQDRNLYERCISRGVPGAMMPGFYNHNYQIFQAPGYVAILVEMIHDVRIIPLDGRPRLGSHVHQWLGDSRGRWEGDTLVVETTNIVGIRDRRNTVFGATGAAHLVERFTRVADDRLDYQLTLTDPTEYAKPWTASIPMAALEGQLFEYACHEGNRGLENILAGARASERSADVAADSR